MLQVQLRQDSPIPLDVSLECAAGELLALVGPSGSGKTSILRTIAGLMQPRSGKVQLGDETWLDTASGVSVRAEARAVGMVFQHYALFPHLTARRSVALALPRGTPDHVADDLLRDMRLEGLADRRPHELSGGQRQRVALARALARQPKLLLLDEAFSAVDQPTRHVLYDELVQLRERVRIPMVMVTHDLREARLLADRICIVDAGCTLQAGAPEQVMARPRNARVAALVGIREIFEGTFHVGQQAGLGWLQVGTPPAGYRLQVVNKGRIDDGTSVYWVAAGQFVRLDLVAQGPNCIPCTVDAVKTLGAVSTVRCTPASGVPAAIHVETSTSQVKALALRAGVQVGVAIDVAGIHIMPIKSERPVAGLAG